MSFGRPTFTSKFVGTYAQLFQGLSPHEITPQEDEGQFYQNLLNLDVKREYLQGEFERITKGDCLGRLKPFLNALFRECVAHGHSAAYDDVKKSHALETLFVYIRHILVKNLTGWEVMEIFAGGVSQSDDVFMAFTALVDDVLADETAPVQAGTRHQVLQAALIYMCAIGQLSPGAYFLRRDLFPSISAFIKSPHTDQFAFEGVLLLAILANFHKSGAARLNPYLKCMKDTKDEDLLRKTCWASNLALCAAIKSYQDISDDTIKSTLTTLTTLGSMFASLRPNRALMSSSADLPRELFKDQPIEATVILLPIFEYLRTNSMFLTILLEHAREDTTPGRIPPLPFTTITLSSYLLTHASSTSSPRSLSYANLSLNIILSIVENDDAMNQFCQPTEIPIHVCRQRLPNLPVPKSKRSAICAVLDCCVLWLRHNLHKRLEVYSFLYCLWICYRVLWFLQNAQLRIEYEWKELWGALVGLLQFLSAKFDSLTTTGGVEQIIRETVVLLELSLSRSEVYLPSPGAIHEFIYELVRSLPVLKNQVFLLKTLALPRLDHRPQTTDKAMDALSALLETVEFYEQKVGQAGARTAKDVLRVVAQEIEVDGLHGARATRDPEAMCVDEIRQMGFGRLTEKADIGPKTLSASGDMHVLMA